MSDEVWNTDRDELRILLQKVKPISIPEADQIINDWTHEAKKFRSGVSRLGGLWNCRSSS